jgi:hypothetical protein
VCTVWNVCTREEEGDEGKGCEEDEECGEEEVKRGGNVTVYKCEKKEEATLDMQLKVVLFVLFLLILLSIGFEQGKDYLYETTSRNLRPIVESLFGELTVLGFIGVVMFFVGQSPALASMSMTLFNEEEMLKELIEQVHMLLFIVMVIFLSMVISLLKFASNISKTWKEWEELSLMDHRDIVIASAREMHTNRNTKTTYQRISSNIVNNTFFTSSNDSIEARHFYICMRLHFATAMEQKEIAEKDASGDKQKKATAPQAGGNNVDLDKVRESFDFSEYLCIIQGKVLSEIVEVSWQTWAFLGVVFLLAWIVIYTVGVEYEVLLIPGIGSCSNNTANNTTP